MLKLGLNLGLNKIQGSSAAPPWYQSDDYLADSTLPVFLADFIENRYAVNGAEYDFADLFSFSRTGTAYYFNSSGVLTAASSNVPRFDYDPATLLPRGLLMETSRTNNLLYSDDLTNAAWTKTNCTAAKNATGPDVVSNSASTLTATSTDATCLQARTLASAARSFSVYVRRKTGAGTVSITRNGGTNWTDITSSLSPMEWIQFKIENTSVTDPSCGIKISVSGDEVEVFGMQDEAGVYSSSYIPTTSATVTRNIEICQNNGSTPVTFASWYNTSAGTLYINDISSPNTAEKLFSFNAGSNFMDLADSGSNNFYRVYNGSFIINPATAHVKNVEKFRAFAYETNNFGWYEDGNQLHNGGTGSPPSDINRIELKWDHGSYYKGILYYDFRVTNSEMDRITT